MISTALSRQFCLAMDIGSGRTANALYLFTKDIDFHTAYADWLKNALGKTRRNFIVASSNEEAIGQSHQVLRSSRASICL